MAQFQDLYRGYQIDYHPKNCDALPEKPYWVFSGTDCLHCCSSYDSAIEWIDKQREASLRSRQ